MSISLSARELINIAVNIEKRGIAFYDVMTRSTENPATREIFQRLVEMEREHIRIFEAMLGEADKYQTVETSTGEHEAYLQTLADSAVFTDEMVTSELATQADTDIQALELAIGAEKDSILFYYEMKETMLGPSEPLVDKIITEEKSHLRLLTAAKKRLEFI